MMHDVHVLVPTLEKGGVRGKVCVRVGPGPPTRLPVRGGTLFDWQLGTLARHGRALHEPGAEGLGSRSRGSYLRVASGAGAVTGWGLGF